jgi:ribosomal protein L22
VRVSPRKAGDVIALIRGKSVSEAKAILMLSPRAAAKLVGSMWSRHSQTAAPRSRGSGRARWVVPAVFANVRATSP